MKQKLSDIQIYNYNHITSFIPFGKGFAISRERLVQETGLSDRMVRKAIAEARENGSCILNNSDGNGYYTPTIKELAEAKGYIRQERNRIKAIVRGLKGISAWVSDVERGALDE